MPIHWRLTLWFALVLSGILLVAGLVAHSLLLGYLKAEIDDNLRVYSARVHGTLHSDTVPAPIDYSVVHSRLPTLSEFASPGTYIQLLNDDGVVVVKSNNLGEQQLPIDTLLLQDAINGGVGLKTLTASDGSALRVIVSPLYLQDEALVLEVGQSLRPVEITMNRLKLSLSGSVLAALLMSSLLGYVIVRRTLYPVKQVTRTAREIQESSDLVRRVNYSGPQDEIAELARTFDRMIDRLDVAFQSQRQFVADASHELRTPLTVMKGNLDLLKRDLSDEDKSESLKALRTETERMARIVEDLLLLAEIEGGRISSQEEVLLEEVLLDAYNRARQTGGVRRITLGRHDSLIIRGDAHRLKQLVGNLVDNAVKYTPEDGNITLTLVKDGKHARIDVSDNGPGIPAEYQPHIFERFVRVDKARSRDRGGTGLGLAIVRQIAESHGGRVSVRSETGKGSTFTVLLPL